MLESRPALELVEPETERATSILDQLQTTCYCRAEIKRKRNVSNAVQLSRLNRI